MTRDEFLELINNYGLKVTHSAITREDGYVIDFALDEVQTRRASMIPSYDWEQFNFKSKMAIVDATNVPLGQIPGKYYYSGRSLRLTGSFEYMWGMIVQIFKGMEKQPAKSPFDETLRKTYQCIHLNLRNTTG